MLPLFFSGLLSYLVGMKRRNSTWSCKNPSIMPLGIFLVLLVDMSESAGYVANSVDPDQNAASDLGLHCLLWLDCPNT